MVADANAMLGLASGKGRPSLFRGKNDQFWRCCGSAHVSPVQYKAADVEVLEGNLFAFYIVAASGGAVQGDCILQVN